MVSKTSLNSDPTSHNKKTYRKPKLTNFGSVVRLTRGGSFIGNEGNTMCDGNANPSMACELS